MLCAGPEPRAVRAAVEVPLSLRPARAQARARAAPLARRSHPREAQGLAHAVLVSLAADSLDRAERQGERAHADSYGGPRDVISLSLSVGSGKNFDAEPVFAQGPHSSWCVRALLVAATLCTMRHVLRTDCRFPESAAC